MRNPRNNEKRSLSSPRMQAAAVEPTSMDDEGANDKNCRPLHELDGIGCVILLGLRTVALRPRLYSLVFTRNFARNECSHSQPADAGGSIKPEVERSRNPRYDQDLSHKPAKPPYSHWPNLNDDEMAHDKKLPPAPRA